jgi:hypothetical protein
VLKVNCVIRSGFKTSDHARGQGTGRFESAAYFSVCEHFERSATPPPGVRRGHETTSRTIRQQRAGRTGRVSWNTCHPARFPRDATGLR